MGGRVGDRPSPARAVGCPLVLDGVWKSYGSTVALAGVDLCIEAGSLVALVGPNGSGKTTLLRAAAGLTEIGSGSVSVVGLPAGSRQARFATALVPDEPSGFDELTGTEFLTLVHSIWAADARVRERSLALVDAFGLGDLIEHRLGTLSRGRRRQVSAVAALGLGTELVLVDEATATLDPEAVVVLGEALRALARAGAGVLAATQDLHFAATVCDEIVLLRDGAVVERGTAQDLTRRHEVASIEEVFLATHGEALLRTKVRNALGSL